MGEINILRYEKFIFLLVIILILVPLIFGFQGSSTSYSSDNKFDVITGGQTKTNSTSFLQRFIGGFQPVSRTSSTSFSGRLGILDSSGNGTIIEGTCGDLTQADSVYLMNKSLTAAGTCFNITANNVTLDCQGNTITYATSVTGYALKSLGYNVSGVKNCNINQSAANKTSSYGIYLSQVYNSTLQNNNISTHGGTNSILSNNGIYLYASNRSVIYGNNITTTARNSFPIDLFNSSLANITANNLISFGGFSYGVYSTFSSANLITLNNITTLGTDSSGVYLSSTNGISTGYSNVTNNNISTAGATSSDGVHLVKSKNDIIQNNFVKMIGGFGTGVYLTNSSSINVSLNTIYSNLTNEQGIYATTSSFINYFSRNNITLTAINSFGIYLNTMVNTTSIDSNIITIYGSRTDGIDIVTNSYNNNVTGNLIYSNNSVDQGINLNSANNNNIINNTVNSYYFAVVMRSSSNNLIYNNIFNTTVTDPVFVASGQTVSNIFNTTKTSATNIISGTNVGGNAYLNLFNTAFSQSCRDANLDGICDLTYTFNNFNKDYLALAVTDNVAPNVSLYSPINESFVNGNAVLRAVANDSSGIKNILFQYQNASVTWTNLAGCNATSSPYTCTWVTSGFSNTSAGYDIRALAFDNKGNSAFDSKHYTIDRNRPIVLDMNVSYPSSQKSARNGQNVTLNALVTDSPSVASGINFVQANVSLLNSSQFVNMTIAFGSKASGKNSTWLLNVTINGSTGNALPGIKVVDSASPTNNVRTGDLWFVTIDNNPPTSSGLTFSNQVYNNSVAGFSAIAHDNFNLSGFIFSDNSSGNWVNDSRVSLTGTDALIQYNKVVYTGNYSFRFFIFDDAGNVNSTSATNIEVFGPAPTPSIYLISPVDGKKLNVAAQNLQYSTNAAFDNCSLYLNDNLNDTQTSPTANVTNQFSETIPDGSYNWYVSCTWIQQLGEDNLSVSYLSNLFSFSIDTVKPILTVISPGNITYNVSAVDFIVNGNESLDYCGYSLDNAGNVTLSSTNDTLFEAGMNVSVTQRGHSVVFSCNDTSGNFNNTAAINFVTILASSRINITSHNNNTDIIRGSDSVGGEDDLGLVPNAVNITGHVYDAVSLGVISNANCFVYFNGTLAGNITSNSTGDCTVQYDKSGESIGTKVLSINYSLDGYNQDVNTSYVSLNLIKYNVTASVTDTFGGNYINGSYAGIIFSIYKINSSGAFLYDPLNITVNATNSANTPYPNNAYVDNYSLHKNSQGVYESRVNPNLSFGNFIKWNIYLSDNNFSSYIGSAVHADTRIASPVCGNSVIEPGETCDDGNTGSGDGCSSTCQIETPRGGTGGGIGGGGPGGVIDSGCVNSWDCTEWSNCANSVQNRICKYTGTCKVAGVKPVEVRTCSCVANVQCSSWDECKGDQQIRTCVDLKGCNANVTIEKKSCNCYSDYTCGNWSDCKASYSVDEIIEGKSVAGSQERTCTDNNKCGDTKVETQSCSLAIPVNIKNVVWCEENYVEIYNNKTNELISRVKETKIKNQSRIDVTFIETDSTRYCGYCSDGVKDFDETDIDCGGKNCVVCADMNKIASYDNYTIYIRIIKWFLWLLLLLIIIIIIERERRKKKKLESELMNLALERKLRSAERSVIDLIVGLFKRKKLRISRIPEQEEKIVYRKSFIKRFGIGLSALGRGIGHGFKAFIYAIKSRRHARLAREEIRKVKIITRPEIERRVRMPEWGLKELRRRWYDPFTLFLRKLRIWRRETYYDSERVETRMKEEERHFKIFGVGVGERIRRSWRRRKQNKAVRKEAERMRKLERWKKQGYYDAEKLEREFKDRKKKRR